MATASSNLASNIVAPNIIATTGRGYIFIAPSSTLRCKIKVNDNFDLQVFHDGSIDRSVMNCRTLARSLVRSLGRCPTSVKSSGCSVNLFTFYFPCNGGLIFGNGSKR